MNSSDSAEEIVKLYLDGVEHIVKIAGVGAKNLAVMLIAMSKEKTQTKGKTRLTNMLKSGKSLKIFTIKAEDLKTFSQEAKRYGVLYCALANKKNSKIDGMVDIMVREEDASRINRIAERFNLRDVASIQKELDKEKQENTSKPENAEIPKSEEEQFIDDIMPKPKEEQFTDDTILKSTEEQFIDDVMPKLKEEQQEIPSNDTKETEQKNQLETFSNTKSKDKVEVSNDIEKKSVKEELKEIEQEIRTKEENAEKKEVQMDDTQAKDKKKQKGGRRYKEKEEKHKGKRYKEPKHLETTKKKNKGRSK